MADQRPWSNDEKNELLADIIRTASPHPSVLFNVIANLNVQPRWDDTPLPRGRSLNSSRLIFEELRRTIQPQSLLTGSFGLQTPLSAPPVGGFKRPFPHDAPYTTGREIRPKPYPPSGSGSVPPSTSEPAIKRKRGRPTKAQAQAKAAAEAAAASDAGPAPPPPLQVSPQTAVSAGSAGAGPAEEAKPALPPPMRMPISAVLTPTAPKTASSSSSSSGKRRRGRSTRSEPEGFQGSGFAGSAQEYESPYGRAIGAPEDTPARTAVLRHREESGPLQQPPRSEPTEPGPEAR